MKDVTNSVVPYKTLDNSELKQYPTPNLQIINQSNAWYSMTNFKKNNKVSLYFSSVDVSIKIMISPKGLINLRRF